MKKIHVSYYIRGRDALNVALEDEIRLYGDDGMCTYMQELCLYLSMLAPHRLIELYSTHYAPAEVPIEIYYGGEEISVDDCGTYFKFDNNTRYVLRNGPTGLHWVHGSNEA